MALRALPVVRDGRGLRLVDGLEGVLDRAAVSLPHERLSVLLLRLHVFVLQHSQLLVILGSLALHDHHARLILVKTRLERDELANGPLDRLESRGGSSELPPVAPHVVILVLHRLHGPVRHPLHAAVVRVGRHHALVSILLMPRGSKGSLHAPAAVARRTTRHARVRCLLRRVSILNDIGDLSYSVARLHRLLDVHSEAS